MDSHTKAAVQVLSTADRQWTDDARLLRLEATEGILFGDFDRGDEARVSDPVNVKVQLATGDQRGCRLLRIGLAGR